MQRVNATGALLVKVTRMIHPAGSQEAKRVMPNDLPDWKTCYHYFRLWINQGV